MKIEITRRKEFVEEIEVDLPYYYRHDLDSCTVYGKIEEKTHTTIDELEDYDGRIKYEIERENHPSIKHSGLASYFDLGYKGSKEEYEEAKKRCLEFLNKC